MFTIMFISFFLGTIMKQCEREHFAPFYSLTNIVNIRARGAYFPLLGKRTQDALFLETVQALEDRRAVANESLRVDQAVQFTKAQETEAKMITSMERQSELAQQQMERQRHQDEVLALRQELRQDLRQERQDEQQAAFNTGFLEVLSQLVTANRSSSK